MGEIKADFPSFAISFATAPTALANCPPFPSVIYMLCMAVWEMIALGHYKWADPSPKFWEEKERGGKSCHNIGEHCYKTPNNGQQIAGSTGILQEQNAVMAPP